VIALYGDVAPSADWRQGIEMHNILGKLAAPLLAVFESGDGPYHYRKSHRTILKVVGLLFLFLSIAAAVAGVVAAMLTAILPALIFLAVGLTCVVVAFLGSDRAVARIWGNQ